MIEIGFGKKLTIDAVLAVAHGARVKISHRTQKVLSARRADIVALIEKQNLPAYGFNRGFGHNVNTAVPPEQLRSLQLNFVRSHACGVGDPLSVPVVRAAMLLRAHSLSLGASAVRIEVVRQLVNFLNNGITPVVPSFGSVGASGDLAPLAHIALGLIGEGEVFVRGIRRPARFALKRARILPLALEMKEGLALTNGIQVSTALGILGYDEVMSLLKHSALTTALSAQVLFGSDDPFLKALHELRPHPGAKKVAGWIWALMRRSPMREVHRPYWVDGEVQDPYNLRCAAQILGACFDLLEEARATFEIEANSATDNPLMLQDSRTGKFTKIVSGGHFHGMPIATKIYGLVQSVCIMARLSNMRCVRFVDEARNKGLGSDLIWPKLSDAERAASSGMMIPEYVSAAITNALWGAAMPSHLFSLSTDAGQEDYVSMSAGLGVRLHEMIPRLRELLAIELAYSAQAAAIRKESSAIPTRGVSKERIQNEILQDAAMLARSVEKARALKGRFAAEVDFKFGYRWSKSARKLSMPCERALREVYRIFPAVKRDRSLSVQLSKLAKLVAERSLIKNQPF